MDMTYSPISRVDDIDPYPKQDIDGILGRTYEISSFTWSSSAITGDELHSIYLPQNLLVVPAIQTLLRRFQYLRADMKVAIRITTTFLHYGKFVVSWRPLSDVGSWILPAAFWLPHVIIDANTPEVVEFTIPYIYPLVFWAHGTQFGNTRYNVRVNFHVLAPLGNAQISTTVNVPVSIYVTFINPKVAGLREESGVNSRIPIGKPVITLRETDDSGGDRILVDPTPEYVYNRSFAPPSLSRNKDTSTRMGMSQLTSVSTHAGLYGSPVIDEMSVDKIVSLPGYLGTFSIASSDLVGTILAHYPTTPQYKYSPAANTWYPTPLSHMAKLCLWWRGSLKYHFIFTCASTVSCRVRFLWSPRTFSGSITTPFGDTVNTVLDINGSTSYSCTIPWLSQYPYLTCGDRYDANTFASGHMYMAIVNPLVVGTSNLTSVITVNAFVSGGPDFELFYPVGRSAGGPIVPPLVIEQMDLKKVFSEGDFPPIIESVYINMPDLNFGERFEHIHDLICRYRFDNQTVSSASSFELGLQGTTFYLHDWLSMYRFARPTVRFKFDMSQFPRDERVSYIPIARPMQEPPYEYSTSDSRFVQIECPYAAPVYFLDTTLFKTAAYVFIPTGDLPSPIRFEWMTAMSDDTTYGFIQYPGDVVRPTPPLSSLSQSTDFRNSKLKN